jgi:hypothetical protein
VTAPLVLLALLAAPDWVDRARSAPPEFAAQLLLRAAAEEKSRPKRIELIDEAFRFATRATVPWPVIARPNSLTLSGRRAEANNQHLDALSLEVRAIEAMLAVSPARAQDLAVTLPVPAPPRPTCQEASAARLHQYYGLALTIASRGFTAKQREEGRHLTYLLGILAASTSPEQLVAATAMVRAFPAATITEQQALTSTLAASLRAAPASPRAFSLTPDLETELDELRRAVRSTDLDQAAETYLKTQRDAQACTAPDNDAFFEHGAGRSLRDVLAAPRRAGIAGLRSVLNQIDGWRDQEGTPPLALFHMRALAYSWLLDHASADEDLSAILSSFIQFLRDAPEKFTAPGEWMVHLRRATAPIAPGEVRSARIALDEIRRAGDPLMNLLADSGELR